MFSMFEQLKIFKSWGMNNNTIALYVGWNQISADQFKKITGTDYVAPTV
ncbi:Hypothetical protein LROSL1_1204 [Furfurilactobacillus rossiae]|nr:XkdX family protein [Furfurilactobacillus rossiae]QLE64021.1 Hypothetical protein LROSL1_1204 [Furfurilactobacillus rossiae]